MKGKANVVTCVHTSWINITKRCSLSVCCVCFMLPTVLIWECYLFDSLGGNDVFAKEEAGRTLGAALASMEQLGELK